ncbi:MAG: sugar phosphate nucleotidyltransferase, partial [Bacilli bacterium]
MKKIRKLVIPVAGMGTRFLPITKSVPKEMLPIVDKPTIELLLEEAVNAGIEEVLFVTRKEKECITKHFTKDIALEEKLIKNNKIDLLNKINHLHDMIKITTVYQEVPLGSGHAISLA